MTTKMQVSASTASSDTTKTLIDTITVPKDVKRIVGIWAHCLGGAGLTTLENITGIVELESEDFNLQPCQIPLDCLAIVGTGVALISPRVWPVDIKVSGGERVKGYVTIDMALTVNNKARFGLVYEV